MREKILLFLDLKERDSIKESLSTNPSNHVWSNTSLQGEFIHRDLLKLKSNDQPNTYHKFNKRCGQHHFRIVDKQFKPLTINQLNQKENVDKWSILECLEHLNRYHAYYNAAIRQGLAAAKANTTDKTYKNGWFGKMSIDMMSPDNVKKQKAIAKFNPVGSQLTKETITKFHGLPTRIIDPSSASKR